MNHLEILILNQVLICFLQKLFQSVVNFELYLSLIWFLPVPVNGRKVSRHGKNRLRNSPGNKNEVYWSRCIL